MRALESAAQDHPGGEPDLLDRLVARRVQGEPIEYIVGYATFCGHRVLVEPGVFVPRQRSVFLAQLTCRYLRPGDRLLDLGCGSGALALVASRTVSGLHVVALDADPAAVACARRNLPDAEVVLGSSLDDLPPEEDFHVVTANLPYVPTGRLAFLPHEARDHEPRLALDGGPDGLTPLRTFAGDLLSRLRPTGRFLVEVADDQVDAARDVLTSAGLARTTVKRSASWRAAVVIARR